MEILRIKNGVIAAFVSKEELALSGINNGGIDTVRAQEMARAAFSELGEDPRGGISVDVYINSCGLMLFAATEKEKVRAVRFSALEELLSYVAGLPHDGDTRLVLYNNEYCLMGECIPENEETVECTEEMRNSQVLIEKRAVESLCNCFRI